MAKIARLWSPDGRQRGCGSSSALATTRYCGWTHRTTTNPTDVISLETWFHGEGRDLAARSLPAAERRPWGLFELWWGPGVGLTERLELAVFVTGIFENPFGPPGAPALPFKAGAGLQPQLRFGLLQPNDQNPFGVALIVQLEDLFSTIHGNVTQPVVRLAAELERGRFAANANVAYVFSHTSVAGNSISVLEHDFGLSVRLAEWLRLGAEAFGFVKLSPTGIANFYVDPAIVISKGNFWWTTSHDFRLTKPEQAQTFAQILSIVGFKIQGAISVMGRQSGRATYRAATTAVGSLAAEPLLTEFDAVTTTRTLPPTSSAAS